MIIVRQNKLTGDILDNNNNNKNKYILLVDDDKDTIFTFDLYLKSIGYTKFLLLILLKP